MKKLAEILVCGVLLGTITMGLDPQFNSTESVEATTVAKTDGTFHFNVTKSEQLPTNGTLKVSAEYVWNITDNSSDISTSGLLFEKVHLSGEDNMTVHLPDENGTVIFGPYNGSVGPLVIVVDKTNFTVKLSTSSSKFQRIFQVMYSQNCIFAIPPTIEILESPIYRENDTIISCTYDYNKIDENVSYSFIFKNFSLDVKSNVDVSLADGPLGKYTETPPDIFGSRARFNMTLNLNSTGNSFTIVRRDLYHMCSGFIQLPNQIKPVLTSPPASKSPNLTTLECRWLIKTTNDGKVLGLVVDTLQFSNVFDMLIVNDGPSELSHPVVQASLINQNETKAKVIRTSGPFMWVSFRSEDFMSSFSGNYSEAQGGYYNGSGNISMLSGSDAVFLLEVSQGEQVLLNFSLSSIASPATIYIYDGFYTTSALIAQLNGSIWYPIVSSASKMRVVASNFNSGKFSAEFSGLKSGCIRTSVSLNDAYVLSGNCNSSCIWVVPPKNISEGVLLLEFQLLSLGISDTIDVFRLGDSKASIARISHGIKHIPQLTFSPTGGFLVNITRGKCGPTDDVIVVARSSYLPGCSGNFSVVPSQELQLSSPNYPNVYPLFASCQWTLTTSGNTSQYYLSFNSMKLAPNHCIQITHSDGNKTKTELFSGNVLPEDMLFKSVAVHFDSFSCNKTNETTSLASNEGFVLNITGSDCGSILSDKAGQFSTDLKTSNSSCFWIVQVPYKESDQSVNSIMFTVEEKGTKENDSEFHIYDGPSVRDPLITNVTGNIWSRNNTVIFVYKKFNSLGATPVYSVNYKTINCNKTMQCANGICLHPDWLCDGHNDCGDFTDERNCETIPVPPSPYKEAGGVSPVAFGIVTVLFFGLGALAAFLIPKAINRFRVGRYHQFQDYSGAD